jgi:hypothetical protein
VSSSFYGVDAHRIEEGGGQVRGEGVFDAKVGLIDRGWAGHMAREAIWGATEVYDDVEEIVIGQI